MSRDLTHHPSGPARAAINHAGLEPVLDTTTTAALQQFIQPDCSVRLDNEFRIAIAHA